MKKSKIYLICFLLMILSPFVLIPIQTELGVRQAKNKILKSNQLSDLFEKYGAPMLIESKEERESYLRDTAIKINESSRLWVFPKEGIPYWNILIITDQSGHIIAGDVDRLW